MAPTVVAIRRSGRGDSTHHRHHHHHYHHHRPSWAITTHPLPPPIPTRRAQASAGASEREERKSRGKRVMHARQVPAKYPPLIPLVPLIPPIHHRRRLCSLASRSLARRKAPPQSPAAAASSDAHRPDHHRNYANHRPLPPQFMPIPHRTTRSALRPDGTSAPRALPSCMRRQRDARCNRAALPCLQPSRGHTRGDGH